MTYWSALRGAYARTVIAFIITIDHQTTTFLGNRKDSDYKTPRSNCTFGFFPVNLRDFSEEQRERFHEDVKTVETRHQGRVECKYDG
ncbi:hypothetical protein EVAR_66524_1 [Eumeta japonica]|uniref:Uncharacterized protein n=1 Tax=Eumeta variegata TaxID=151549 RepID=A0A4C1ZCU8_EUMVA|nr:hypothetical protein EVAR_66524_1 [Eumeta japonica]